MIELKVPTVGESISEVTLLKWVKNNGDLVQRDEVIAELESEKATFELNADEAGELKQVAKEGDVLKIGDVVATIDTNVAVVESKSEKSVKSESQQEKQQQQQPATATKQTATISNLQLLFSSQKQRLLHRPSSQIKKLIHPK